MIKHIINAVHMYWFDLNITACVAGIANNTCNELLLVSLTQLKRSNVHNDLYGGTRSSFASYYVHR